MNKDIRNTIAAIFALVLVGSSPFPAAAGARVYIPLGSSERVVIIDAEKDAIVGKIEGLPAVHGLAGTPGGGFLIAGSYRERVPDAEIPAKPSSVSEDEHAAHHGAAPSGPKDDEAAVSTVSVVRTADGSVVRRIDVPGAVHHVAVSPGGRFAVVTHPNEGTISAIDLGTYEVIANVPTGLFPNYAAFGPDGRQLYVSNAGDGTVSAVDTARWAVQWDANVGSSPEHVVLSANGGSLYVNNVDDGTVSVIDIGKRAVAKTIPVGGTLHGIDLSDDGKTLFVASLGGDKVDGIDIATGTSRSVRLAPAPYHLATVRGAGKIYVSSADEPKIWVLDQKSFAVLGEIAIGGKGHQMVLSPGA